MRREYLPHLKEGEPDSIPYLPASGKEAAFIGAQTIAANHLQASRDPAQQEPADWMRFNSDDVRKWRDGLAAGSMEIGGLAGWEVR